MRTDASSLIKSAVFFSNWGGGFINPVMNLEQLGLLAVFEIKGVLYSALAYTDEDEWTIDIANYDGEDFTRQTLREWLNAPREVRRHVDAEYKTISAESREALVFKLEDFLKEVCGWSENEYF